MDDDLPAGIWSIDPDTRGALRLERAHRFFRGDDWVEAIIELEELLDEEPDHVEALFLLGEASLECGESALARHAYERVVALTGGDATSLLGLAISRFDTCDLIGAVEAARASIRSDPSRAEAHWYLGLALERLPQGTTEAMTALTAAHQLDPGRFPTRLRIDDRTWMALISEAMDALPPALQALWQDIPIRIEDWPALDELRAQEPPIPPTVACLYLGTPPADEDPFEVRPEALRLFRRNLERAADLPEVVERIGSALQSEGMDWLGVSDLSELEA